MGDLILGTAQLGQVYGIANRTGQPDRATAHAIVTTAWEYGIRSFDTAPDYGDAECLLGDALMAIGASPTVRVMTKLETDVDVRNRDAIVTAVEHSRERLRVPRIHELLVRRALLNEWASIRPALRQLIADGVVERVGVSVYTPEEASRALALDDITFVQVPTNILDRRFLAAGVLDRVQATGKTIVIRSVFLQGLLTMSPEEAPPIPGAREALQGIQRASHELGVNPITLAFAYVRERCPDADILVGAETSEQVAELASLWQKRIPPCVEVIERYVSAGVGDLMDPTRWPARQFTGSSPAGHAAIRRSSA